MTLERREAQAEGTEKRQNASEGATRRRVVLLEPCLHRRDEYRGLSAQEFLAQIEHAVPSFPFLEVPQPQPTNLAERVFPMPVTSRPQ